MNYELIRNADVEVVASTNSKGHPIATINVNDRYIHDFDASSRVSESLDLMTAEDLEQRLTGGHFFFINGELYDFRDGYYSGFVHTDDSISHLVDVIGIENRLTTKNGIRVHENVVSRHFNLGTKWSDHGITVPGYKSGGDFRSELHFGWNPFVKTINSAFMLYRLICENGMRGLRSFMNTRIPLFNRWEEHLDIANRQIQMKVSELAHNRIEQMGRHRASVAEVSTLTRHAHSRLVDVKTPLSGETRERLKNIRDISAPTIHLGSVYRGNVFTDMNLAAQHPAHLTVFDVFNMVTELRSHTVETDKSSNLALDKLSNGLMFDRKDMTQHATKFSSPRLSSFSDPDAAFFGIH